MFNIILIIMIILWVIALVYVIIHWDDILYDEGEEK